MKYVEMSIEEAIRKCKRNAKILVATQDLADDNPEIIFLQKKGSDYKEIFEDVQTVASLCDDLVKQLKLFTEKQNIYNIEPHGKQKIIMLRE